MQRRSNLAHLILASVVVLRLTPLNVDAQAQIVFASNRDGNWEIYLMDADGGKPKNLTKNRHDDRDPSWSPDGKGIAFTSGSNWNIPGGNEDIYVMDANGQNRQRLAENRQNDWYPSWSPAGEQIVFMSNRDGDFDIYVMDADGGNPQNLTNNNRQNDISPAWFNSPFSVSPTGKKFTMWGWLKQVD